MVTAMNVVTEIAIFLGVIIQTIWQEMPLDVGKGKIFLKNFNIFSGPLSKSSVCGHQRPLQVSGAVPHRPGLHQPGNQPLLLSSAPTQNGHSAAARRSGKNFIYRKLLQYFTNSLMEIV